MRLRSFHSVLGTGRVFRTEIVGHDVRVIVTGIGPINSVQSIRTSMDEAPDFCIASGLTGGLKHEHRPGEVLVAHAASSKNSGETFNSDEKLLSAAVDCGAKPVDRFVSTGRVVRTAKRKSELHSFADAVDMESFAIMKEMSRLRVPCVAVRSVADSAEMDVPCDFDLALDGSGRVRLMQVLGQVVCDPRQAWPLARFGARSSRAASSLAQFLDGYTVHVGRHPERLEFRVQQISQ